MVAAAPPLSDEQCARIAALLRCGGGQPAADRAAVVADRLADLDGGAA
ncbi:hypothetical protein MMON44395_10660 [Mycolicibacterium monacense DSM 44395]|nr:hypothetical protein [Mycolicibacterium monacense DSM 44395]